MHQVFTALTFIAVILTPTILATHATGGGLRKGRRRKSGRGTSFLKSGTK
jgi:hypothetical protein